MTATQIVDVPLLLTVLTRLLPPSQMAILVKLLNDYRAKKSSQQKLNPIVRLIVGEKVLPSETN